MKYVCKFEHPEHPQMFAAVVLASKPTNGAPPLFTIHGCYPRIIHGEVLTHRVKSRNGRSSRAVPIKTMLNEVRTDPFVPWHWGKNQSGMQAGEDHNAPVASLNVEDGQAWIDPSATREEAWLDARDFASNAAEAYMEAGYHKQIPNRLLEPFSWMHNLISSTSWANFIHLRDHKDAEPHFQDWARLVNQALAWVHTHDAFIDLDPGHWHLPYITEHDWDLADDWLHNRGDPYPTDVSVVDLLKKISAARCARISYTPFDGDGSFEAELRRYDGLVNSDRIHASPLEHQATPDVLEDTTLFDNDGNWVGNASEYRQPELHGNLRGWVQYRKTLAGEYMADAA